MNYYKNKGLVRFIVTITEAEKQKIEEIAKEHGVSQGDVVDVALEEFYKLDYTPLLLAKKNSKVDGRRGSKKADFELLAKIKKLDPKVLAELLAKAS
jgi:hypothetical protein